MKRFVRGGGVSLILCVTVFAAGCAQQAEQRQEGKAQQKAVARVLTEAMLTEPGLKGSSPTAKAEPKPKPAPKVEPKSEPRKPPGREHKTDGEYRGPRLPPIEGAVVGVSQKHNLVVLNVGEDDQVQVGFTFTIYRGREYVAKMVVEKVFPRQCAGRVLKMTARDKVRIGDKAATRIY